MDRKFYRFSDACKKIGVSTSTYLRYVKDGIFDDVQRDGRNWRIFYDEDIEKIMQVLKQKGLIPSQRL